MNAMSNENSAVFEGGKYTLPGDDDDLDGSATEFRTVAEAPKTQYQIVANAMRKKEGGSDKPAAAVKYLKKVGASLLNGSSNHGRRSLGLASLSGHLRRSVSGESPPQNNDDDDEEGLIDDFHEETEEQKMEIIEAIRRSRTMGASNNDSQDNKGINGEGSPQTDRTDSTTESIDGKEKEKLSDETSQKLTGEGQDADEDSPKKKLPMRKRPFNVGSVRPPPAIRGVGRTRSFENPFNGRNIRPPMPRKPTRSRSFGDGTNMSLHRRTSVSESVDRALDTSKRDDSHLDTVDDSARASTKSEPVKRNPKLGAFFRRSSSKKLNSDEEGAAKSVTSIKSEIQGLPQIKTEDNDANSLPPPKNQPTAYKSVLKSDSSLG
ncbi:MAG: hypothetical protein SGILL_005160, partial [Bacillariaceae sp.]